MHLKIKKLDNLWIDLAHEIKFPILDRAVKAGYLKKEFIKEMKELETNEDQRKRPLGKR